MDTYIKAFLIAAPIFFVFTLTVAIIFFSCRRFMKPSHQTQTQPIQTRIGSTNSPEHNPNTIYKSFSFDLYSRISMADLTAATKNFSPDLIIGDSSFGLVYKGRLSNGVVVAVKKLHSNVFQGLREFRAEMETLGQLRHRNILPLVGYCESGNDRLLVYKFMERGNLDQWLHDTSSVKGKFLVLGYHYLGKRELRLYEGLLMGFNIYMG
ncbi:Receptor-like kinase [Quillaja saponaria]|uniref:Receptor-like kinase n=1 Tax=Quillaja saponaria TaxID=32244 RepID=A0AAD7PBL7_QUISA|nr:Receptor-like kinase [Quillaja saponaria]